MAGSGGEGGDAHLALGDVLLLLVLRALEAEELLTLQLIELGLDVLDRVGDARDDNRVERVHAAGRDLWVAQREEQTRQRMRG